MKKLLPILTLSLAALTSAVNAQTDTTKFDLGRIAVHKKLTQAVTVKGTDLQKLPFTSLNDAVNTWFYGVYGASANYVTVIDGNLISDINAYSVYDIEEITLVQNSLTHLNGISPSQILLLVKTKRGNRAGTSGVDVNGQANYVNLRNTTGTGKSTSNFYHQYYISPYLNKERIKAGISANVQRSTTPLLETDRIAADQPRSLTRVKLNGYADLQVSKKVSVSLNGGYTPQTDTAAFSIFNTGLTQKVGTHTNHYLWYGNLSLNANITNKLTDRVSVGVQQYDRNYNTFSLTTDGSGYYSRASGDSSITNNNFLIRNDLSYKITAGRWTIEPNINITHRLYKNNTVGNMERFYSVSGPSGSPISAGGSYVRFGAKDRATLLTPSIAIGVDNAFLLQTGFQYRFNIAVDEPFDVNNPFKPGNKILPFVSLSANILRSDAGPQPDVAWNIYGSYAKSMANMSDLMGTLSDGESSPYSGFTADGYYPGFAYFYATPRYNKYKTFDQVQLGTTFSLLKNKLRVSYNYNVRNGNNMYIIYVVFPGSGSTSTVSTVPIYPEVRTDMHRLGIDWHIGSADRFDWTAGLNGSVVKAMPNFASTPYPSTPYASGATGNITSGGFINRFSYKSLAIGLDLLYRINQDNFTVFPAVKTSINSFDVKNLYIAYQPKPTWAKGAEVFINARNLLQNKQSTITDNRRYYGLGLMLNL